MSDWKDFSDLYIPEDDPENGQYFPGPSSLSPELKKLSYALVQKSKKHQKINFTISHNNYVFRAHKMPTINGYYYIFRRMPENIWSLRECGIKTNITNYIMDKRHLKGGLFIISGMPGNGKSTTCSAVIVERLKRYAGLCITIEDPVEMPLQGMHGQGMCLQRNVEDEEEFSSAVKDALRAYPTQVNTMMLIGEVRDSETASLALRSAVDGRLVLVTLHAGNVIQAIKRILTMASESMRMEEARSLLASSLRLVLHQQLIDKKDSINEKELKLGVLFDSQSVSGVLSNNKVAIETLINEHKKQMNILSMGRTIDVRRLD